MEKINAGILKKQIFVEIDSFFNLNNQLNKRLFLTYLNDLLNYYEDLFNVNQSFIKELNILKEIELDDECFETNVKIIISTLTDNQVLLLILEFFIGKNNARKFIYI